MARKAKSTKNTKSDLENQMSLKEDTHAGAADKATGREDIFTYIQRKSTA